MGRPSGCSCKCKCDGAWTPSKLPCNYCILNQEDFTFKFTDNPFARLLNDKPIGIPLDGEITGPLIMPGGATDFGAGSLAGIGYFGVNSDSVRLSRYCEWSEGTITAFRPYDEIVNQEYEYSVNDGPKLPKRFELSEAANIGNCTWSDSSTTTIATIDATVGVAPSEAVTHTKTVSFDRVPYSTIGLRPTTLQRRYIPYINRVTGVPMTQAEANVLLGGHPNIGVGPTPYVKSNVIYNNVVGLGNVKIKNIPVAECVFNPTSYASMWGPSPQNTPQSNKTDYQSGPLVDPPIAQGGGVSVINQIMNRKDIIPNYTTYGYNSGRVEAGRLVSGSCSLSNSLYFQNGTWSAGGSATFSFNARSGVFYNSAVTARTPYAPGPETCFPITNAPRLGEPFQPTGAIGTLASHWKLDYSAFNNTDPEGGYFMGIGPVTVPPLPRSAIGPANPNLAEQWRLWDLADGVEEDYWTVANPQPWNSPYATINSIAGFVGQYELAIGKHHYPYFLGNEDVTITLTPESFNDSFTRFTRWNAVSESFTLVGIPGYTKITEPDDKSDMAGTTSNVIIDNWTAYPPATISSQNTVDNKWQTFVSPVDSEEYAVAVSGATVATWATITAPGDPVLTRSCTCTSIWQWTPYANGVFTGIWQWNLVTDACSGATATPPSTPGTNSELRNGTCV